MTDDTPESPFTPPPADPPTRPVLKRKPGWQKGRPRLRPTPAQREPIRETAVKSAGPRMKATPNWPHASDEPEGVDQLFIPREILKKIEESDGVRLQWATASVRGDEDPKHRANFARLGWTEVNQSDFGGVLNGRFMSKDRDGEIRINDAVLVAIPIERHERMKQREKAQAREPLQIKEQQIHGGLDVPGGAHPSAVRQNRINKTLERIAVPDE